MGVLTARFRSLFATLKDRLFMAVGGYNHLSSEAYIKYARRQGCEIGAGTQFFGEKKLDLSLAPLITIGDDCVITDRVRLLVHTWDTTILNRRFDGEATPTVDGMGPITIGDNVFIGENTFVLPNVTIGDNTIIGAGSVVTADVPGDCVAAGNPCDVIMTLDEYRKQRAADEEMKVSAYLARCEERDVEPAPAYRLVVDE